MSITAPSFGPTQTDRISCADGEEKNPINFTLLNDFEVIHKDSTGNQKHIPKADTSKAAIVSIFDRPYEMTSLISF